VGETNLVKDTAEAVRGVVEAVPVYQDALQPAMREVGKGLETVTKAVLLALEPLKSLVWGYDTIKDYVTRRVAEKLRDVPPERIVPPKPNVAGPAIEALRFTGHEEELREMYANLLASSLDKETASKAHPAFVDIIKSLTPDEARIMRLFSDETSLPILDVVAVDEERSAATGADSFKPVLVHFSTIGEDAGCEHPELAASFLDNLERLGLIRLPGQYGLAGPGISVSGIYDRVERSADVESLRREYRGKRGWRLELRRHVVDLTSLGRQFCNACIVNHEEVVGTPRSGPRDAQV
jgi:hypothetical protein